MQKGTFFRVLPNICKFIVQLALQLQHIEYNESYTIYLIVLFIKIPRQREIIRLENKKCILKPSN